HERGILPGRPSRHHVMQTKGSDLQRCQVVRILLLEDDDAMRERFAGIIEGWSEAALVAACATLEAALTVLREEAVDLLMTDLNLPDGHGIEAIRLLRREQPNADAMVISVLADDQTVLQAIEAGAVGYLLKDADSFELVEAIKELR